jgi:hypothetical protein
MLTGCSRGKPVCIPGASGVLPLYTARGSGDAPWVVADCASGVAVAGTGLACVSWRFWGLPDYGLGGTIAMVTWSWCLMAEVTDKMDRRCQPSEGTRPQRICSPHALTRCYG